MTEPKFYWDIDQNTEAWRKVRAGLITGTSIKTFIKKGSQENGLSAAGIDEMYLMLDERLSGCPRENFKAKSTDWGHKYEPVAVEHYERKFFVKTKTAGFIQRNEWAGSSPDRLIPSIKEGLEIKCFPTRHMKIFDTQKPIYEDYEQCQWNLFVSKWEIWNLYYFHPRLPESCNSIRFRFTPDEKMFKAFEVREQIISSMVQRRFNKHQLKI